MQPNYLGTRADQETMIAALKISRRIFQTPTMQRYVVEEFWPGAQADSDEALLEHAKETGSTTFHQTSTCMMGSPETAVVDSELRVHGMERLRVVDASVMPTVISGNTNAATIMIAEKASDMIRAAGRVGTSATARAA
jgi:choline dehydrogenase-like flavoprotein